MKLTCRECREMFPGSETRCPHCGRPSLFPNVTAASEPEEQAALEKRYQQECSNLARRSCDSIRANFETAIISRTKAILCTNMNECQRVSNADNVVFSTYYDRVHAGLHIPTGGKWDVLRGVVEHAMFPGYKEHIRFGALSLDGNGVWNYGECAITLKDHMVTHRTSLFEDNNVVFTAYDQRTTMEDAINLTKGHRAVWDTRDKLCVAKLSSRLHSGLGDEDFDIILLEQGATTRDDRFVELHIWGPITVRAIEYIRVRRRRHKPRKVVIKDLERTLAKFSVKVEYL